MCRTSGQKTSSCMITASPGKLHGLIFGGAAAAAGTIDIFDEDEALGTGTRLIPQINFIATADNDRIKQITFPTPVDFYKGMYLKIEPSAGTIDVNVYFEND